MEQNEKKKKNTQKLVLEIQTGIVCSSMEDCSVHCKIEKREPIWGIFDHIYCK